MHHDPRGFDHTDDALTAALQAALPIVQQLRAERAKPQPRNVQELGDWRGYIAELELQLAPHAAAAGISAHELERIAATELRHRPPAPAAQPRRGVRAVAPIRHKTPAEVHYGNLVGEELQLLAEITALDERQERETKRRTLLVKQLKQVRVRARQFDRNR